MTELLTAAQMRGIEQDAIDSGDVTGLDLMERAGQGVVEAIFAEWPQFATDIGKMSAPDGAEREASLSRSPGYRGSQRSKERRAVVLCGPGNNGGDGFVVARLLKEACCAVEVFLYGDAEKLPPDAHVNYERWRELGDVVPLTEKAFRCGDFAELYIDALFGTGLSRPVEGDLASLLRHLGGYGGDNYQPRMVSIDMPTGLCADSGRVLTMHPKAAVPAAVVAGLTVTFDSPKRGHFIASGPDHCGKIKTVDIGVRLFREQEKNPHTGHFGRVRFPRTSLVRGAPLVQDSRPFFQVDLRLLHKGRGHKYAHGHAFVLSGGVGQGGAARLAARGALRVGAGAVTIGCPAAAMAENAAQLNAIMLREVPDAAALVGVLGDKRMNAVCVGPGLGLGAREAALVDAVCEHAAKVVLDADALTLLARRDDPFAKLHKGCVLTPHAGEFARLFPDIAHKLAAPATKGPAYSKVDATREAATRAGCVVLFKGPDTVIADRDGRCSINASVYERSAPWLATAGSGDVLAGLITGLLARCFAPIQAAETGAWLHTECALHFGPGLIAEDLPEELPKVFRKLGIT